jgi:putative hemolysin
MTVVLFAAGLLLVAVFTAAAAAVRSVSRIWLRHWVEERLAGTGAATLALEDTQQMLLAASTAVAIVAFATGAVLGTRWATVPRTLIEQLVIAAVLVLIVGQLIPRAIGRRWATALVPVTVPALRVLGTLLAPLVSASRAVAGSWRTGSGPAAPAVTDEREVLEDLLREGELEGVGDAGESAIISGVVEFTEKRVRDVMTPRSEIFFLDQQVPAAELAAQFGQAKFSRVPITGSGIDHVVGMLHAFDVLKWDGDAPPVLRKVVFAPEAAVATELLFKMLRERVHLAIIQDAAARTVGLVTLEDLLEELVGDIRDEHDEPVA